MTPPLSESNQSLKSSTSTGPWSDEEKQALCKTVIRFPPGMPNRWEKIADIINRPVSQVIDMAKQMQSPISTKNNVYQNIEASISSTVKIDQSLITKRQELNSSSDWSQHDQKLLECALKTIPKDIRDVDRWEQIAKCIPGKTREQCLARYRHIVQLVKAKKMA